MVAINPTTTTGYTVPDREDTSLWTIYSPSTAADLQDLFDGTVAVSRPAVIEIPDSGLILAEGFNITDMGDPSLGWVYIQPTSERLATLPAETRRVDRDLAGRWPAAWTKLEATNGGVSTITVDYGANAQKIRFIGLEVTRGPLSVARSIWDVGRRKSDDSQATSQSDHPENIIIEQCYVHAYLGDWSTEQRETLTFNASNSAVVDNFFEGTRSGSESKGIWVNNSAHNITIENNSVEAGASCIFLGGTTVQTGSPNLWEDVLIQGNVCYHSRRWDPLHASYVGTTTAQKNLIEAKGGRRIGIYRNHCHTLYKNDFGQGFGLILNNTSQFGSDPHMELIDVDVMWNKFEKLPKGVQVVGASNTGNTTKQGQRIRIEQNFFEIDNEKDLLSNIGLALSTGLPDVGTIGLTSFQWRHNSTVCLADGGWRAGSSGSALFLNLPTALGDSIDEVEIVDNITFARRFVIFRNGGLVKDAAMDAEFINYTSSNTLTIAGTEESGAFSSNEGLYKPESFWWEDDIADVQFVDPSNGDWALQAISPYAAGNTFDATDGTDIGVHFTTLNTNILPAVNGTRSGGGSPGPLPGNMVSTLTHSPADIVRYTLIQLGYGSLPEDNLSWPISVGVEPDTPDNVVTIYDTSGLHQGRTQIDGRVQERYGFQVRVRAVDHPQAHQKINSIMIALDQQVYDEFINIDDSQYLVKTVSRVTTPLSIGQQAASAGGRTTVTKREVFTINGTVKLEQQ